MDDQQSVRTVADEPGRCAQRSVSATTAGPPIYEQFLDQDLRWALSEGSRHFEEDSAVFKALRNIAQRLKSLGIPYATVGGMALFKHGFRRFTEDVDLLVTKKDLKRTHRELEGRGYLPPFSASKNLRDTEFGVKIVFLITGAYPGDGKPKPVSFPDPKTVVTEIDGISYVNLPTLIELKLASGMTGHDRRKDLSDVLEVIKTLDLSEDFADQLNPFVRVQFKELWNEAKKRHVRTWRNKWLTAKSTSIEEMTSLLRAAADELDQMRKDGVILEDNGGVADDHALLVTTDPKIAEKYGMIDELHYWDTDDDNPDDALDTTVQS